MQTSPSPHVAWAGVGGLLALALVLANQSIRANAGRLDVGPCPITAGIKYTGRPVGPIHPFCPKLQIVSIFHPCCVIMSRLWRFVCTCPRLLAYMFTALAQHNTAPFAKMSNQ